MNVQQKDIMGVSCEWASTGQVGAVRTKQGTRSKFCVESYVVGDFITKQRH